MTRIEKVLYTGRVRTTGGRLDLQLSQLGSV